MNSTNPLQINDPVSDLLSQMTLAEKVGQMSQVDGGWVGDDIRHGVASGAIGSLLNVVDVNLVNELQRIAVEDSRLGIPLLIGRDVIHGFKTVFPIPLGQAASWNPDTVRECAHAAAAESSLSGVNWTFAPMIDICRDPRWGRIAESPGEDPYLASIMAVAMVEGFQGDDLSERGRVAACAKHFAGYGASEAGRDYAATSIPENELRNVFLPPFKAAVDAGVATLMASFGDLNGVPASGNEWLMRDVLRQEWGFQGFVISDWDSVLQLSVHGLTANDREACQAAVKAGIDMEMASTTYRDHLQSLIESGEIEESMVDAMVSTILKLKFDLGLFDNPYTDTDAQPVVSAETLKATAYKAAQESLVLLQNQENLLPLNAASLGSVAVIGPMADEPYEQLGTWIFDGEESTSVSPLKAFEDAYGDQIDIQYVRSMETTRDRSHAGFAEAKAAARKADAVLMFLGEESILSGEAHSRADISLPGAQEALINELAATGKPLVLVILAGRPLTLTSVVDKVSAILYAWHPGSMGGPAIIDTLFGRAEPCGKLPATFPNMVGQVPIYYAHKNSGKPATDDSFTFIDDIPRRAKQTSVGNTSFHLDAGFRPLYPFGFGLSYTNFDYRNIRIDRDAVPIGGAVKIAVELVNTGNRTGTEVAQLYVRDRVGSVTRPVRELKGFQRVTLAPGESRTVTFELSTDELAFYGRSMTLATEPGQFEAWIGGDSTASLGVAFEVTATA